MAEDDLIDAEPVTDDANAEVETEQPMGMTGEQILASIMNMPNIAEELEKTADGQRQLDEIGAKVCAEYQIDEASRKAWLDKSKDALKLAMLTAEQKNYPFENAANVKYPLLTVAALQFNARAYPAIVAPDRVVKCKVRGRDPSGEKARRADRVSEYMSDQLLHEMPEWEEDTDRLLVMTPIVGSVFRKAWYDPALRRNVTKLVTADCLVVNNAAASLESAPRITEKLRLYPYEIEERIRDGRFCAFEYDKADRGYDADEGSPDTDNGEDESAPHCFLEQHRLLDLDEDGYPEPYIVTLHKGLQKVVRIVANFAPETVTIADDGRVAAIRRQNYFVHYRFMPNPESGFYGVGFGWLLASTNETINSTLNQMMDAGHLANMQGGLIGSVLGIREKNIRLERGEWRVVNTSMPLNQAVMPIKYDGPSPELFKLLGLLVEMGKEVAAVKDVLTGDTPSTAPVGTTLALIEQGLQVFTSIYKRIHRALKFELAILGRLNWQNLSPEQYTRFFDDEQASDPKADFNAQDMDILPVSDPQSVTKMQKIAKAQMVMEVSKENPLINPIEALKRFFEAADIEDHEKLIMPPPEPDPAEQAFMAAMRDLGLQEQMAKITEAYTKALKNVADAEAAEEGPQLSLYQMFLEAVQAEHSMEMAQNEQQALAGAGGVPGVAGAPGNAGGAPSLPGSGGAGQGAGGGATAPAVDLSGAGMGQPAGSGGIPQGAL